ncbi:MAG: response regulator transcription factor [Bacteroidota bacterium]
MSNRPPLEILVVDDEQDIELLFRQRFRKALREGWLRMQFAFSGESALEILSQAEQPGATLILSDINMPGMSGLALLEQVRNRFPKMKVVMVTAYGDEAHRMQSEALGAFAFLSKPVDFPVLEALLESLHQELHSAD